MYMRRGEAFPRGKTLQLKVKRYRAVFTEVTMQAQEKMQPDPENTSNQCWSQLQDVSARLVQICRPAQLQHHSGGK